MSLVGFARDLPIGARAVGRGLGLVLQPGLRRYVVVPLALNALLFAAGIWVLVRWLTPWVDQLSERFGGFLGVFAWVGFAGLTLLLVWQTFVIVGAWVGSPFYGFLAQAVERRCRGRTDPGGAGLAEILGEARFALLQECRKAWYFLRLVLPVLVLGLVPMVQILAPVLWVLVSAWILAVESFDFPLSNRRIGLAEQRSLLWERPGIAWGLGLATLGLGLVPVLQLLAVPASVAAATSLWVVEWPAGADAAAPADGIGPPRASNPPIPPPQR